MSIFDRLFRRGGGGSSREETSTTDANAVYYFVRCDKCGEALRIRIDRRWDLEQEFEGEGDAVSGYVSTKEVIGKKCFQMMQLTVHFDRSYREVGKELLRGTFITRQEFEEAQAATG